MYAICGMRLHRAMLLQPRFASITFVCALKFQVLMTKSRAMLQAIAADDVKVTQPSRLCISFDTIRSSSCAQPESDDLSARMHAVSTPPSVTAESKPNVDNAL